MSLQPSAAANAAMSSQTCRCTAGVADDALLPCLRPASNCGLISASRLHRRRRKRQRRRQHELQRDEADVDDDEVGPRRQARAGRACGCRSPPSRRSRRVRAASGCKLAVADIDGKDAGRAAREQHLREAAGRGADVEADVALDIERKCSSAPASLTPPRETQGCAGVGLDRRVRRDRRPTASRPALPSAITRPAAIAACARARLSKKPRSTNSRSARFLAAAIFYSCAREAASRTHVSKAVRSCQISSGACRGVISGQPWRSRA